MTGCSISSSSGRSSAPQQLRQYHQLQAPPPACKAQRLRSARCSIGLLAAATRAASRSWRSW
eukprot:1878082-Lingulodinium_polyedra.AAC.1